jgi:spoIIIJ-associated protein
MRSIESEGDNIDQAIDRALRTLQVDRDQVEVEIVADATRGLFGFGGTKARVRATVRAPLGVGLTIGEPTHDASRETSTLDDGVPRAVGGTFDHRCRTVLTELLSHVGVSCTVEAHPGAEPGTLVLDVRGDSGGLLIGRRGQTLDAIEYIVNRIVGRGDDRESGRVMIDVERYRERRAEYLATLARRLASKVKDTGRVVTLNPMSPRDRRLVHIALQDDSAVVTRSQGDGHYRKVLILPADKARKGPHPGRPARPAD